MFTPKHMQTFFAYVSEDSKNIRKKIIEKNILRKKNWEIFFSNFLCVMG